MEDSVGMTLQFSLYFLCIIIPYADLIVFEAMGSDDFFF